MKHSFTENIEQILKQEFGKNAEEIINLPLLITRFEDTVKQGYLNNILDEIILQSKVEFSYEE